MFQLSRDEQIALVIGFLLIAVIIFSFFLIRPNKYSEASKVDIPQSNIKAVIPSKNIERKMPERIYVHIAGEVRRPNVYVMWKGSRVFEVIALAGLTEESDVDGINLAKILNDGEKITVMRKGESPSLPVTETVNSGVRMSGTININTASQQELESLPGIGTVYASRILEYRSVTPFRKKEDLMNVKGIGPKTFEKIRDKIGID